VETPSSDVEGAGKPYPDPDVATQLFLPLNPDVEREGPSDADVGSPNPPKTPPKLPRSPDVEVETPNPDVEGTGEPCPDPGVATQLFLPPDPDVEHLESPKTAPKEPRVPDVEGESPNPDVGGAPGPAQEDAEAPPTPQVRRSQRLAESRGGGASGGPTPTGNGRGLEAEPRPQRRRAQAGVVLEQATPSMSRKGNGRGSVSATPPQEKEAAEGAKRSLRPRAVPGPAHIRVLFTGLVASPALLVALGTLGGTEATSVRDCSHLVTDGIRRTLKFLCALGRGIPIVTPQWLLQSSQGGRPLSPGPFLPRDPPCERRFGFRLRPALARAQARPLLQGYQVHVTPSVQPCPEDMQDIVTCCGGTFLPQMPREHAVRGQGTE
ncbi:MDC1 protein, partial [Locustella ochotensis]|nr:MDC1 protein [Locustella ochotensis]